MNDNEHAQRNEHDQTKPSVQITKQKQRENALRNLLGFFGSWAAKHHDALHGKHVLGHTRPADYKAKKRKRRTMAKASRKRNRIFRRAKTRARRTAKRKRSPPFKGRRRRK